MFITDSQNSPLKNISDINGQLAYRGQIISGSAGTGSSNLPTNSTGYLYNDGNGNLSWDNKSFSINNKLSFWFSADSGVYTTSGIANSGDLVAAWQDTKGLLKVSQSTSSLRPIYQTNDPLFNNKPIIYFASGVDTKLTATLYGYEFAGRTEFEQIYVLAPLNNAYANPMTWTDSPRIGTHIIPNGNSIFDFQNANSGNGRLLIGTETGYNIKIVNAIINGPYQILKINNQTGSYFNTFRTELNLNTSKTIYIGSPNDVYAGFYGNCKLSELITWKRCLSEKERNYIYDYLKNKYNITL